MGLLVCNSAYASNLNPEKILDSVDDIYRSNTSHGILTLAVTTANWQRTLTLEQWSKGKNKHLIKVLKPKKEKDLATLLYKNNVCILFFLLLLSTAGLVYNWGS